MTDISKLKLEVGFEEAFTVFIKESDIKDAPIRGQCIKISVDPNQEVDIEITNWYKNRDDRPTEENLHVHSTVAYRMAKRIIRLLDQYDEEVACNRSCKDLL